MSVPAWPFVLALLGAVIGSFLNVVADRIPDDQSLVSPRSYCPACKRQLHPLELIPIVSYLALRGRCRTCGARIPLRVFGVEVASGLVFGLAAVRFGLSLHTALVCLFSALLIVFFVIDLEHGLVPNRLLFPSMGLAIFAIPFAPWEDPLGQLVGGVLSFGVLFAIAHLAAGGMGMGDVKLAALLGVILGFPAIVPGLLVAFISGGAVAGGLLLAGRIERRDPMPFGPFLSAAGVLFLLYGDQIVHWWLGGGALWS
ncbi:MAG: prepilin peptidase [Anaerolineales bacterium]|nr:prepilin peptidase [Anaerolineales bacterium]